MGLITGLLTLPLAPVRGVAWVADKLVAVAEEQFYDVDAIYAELRELAADLDEGRISEEEFDRAEDVLLQRLQDATARNRST
ncbi:gas vesicle protein GvpG [Jatrophihabitans sp.]|uniref:gas vesicle protein GvpG n=1 Tax=Jatrophihabitans sp. TaxID=1932789 RepID=UPI002BA9AE2D|nr:gas vesicle protein GvpG [Jatrophihabitans sp.]